MTNVRSRWRITIGTVLLIVFLVGTITLAQGKGTEQGPGGALPFKVDHDEVTHFEQQGHSKSDVYTALNLQEQTGVPVGKWLEAIKRGLTWVGAIEELAKDKPLEKLPINKEGSRTLSEQEITDLIYDGYSGLDIIEAGKITYLYGGEPRALLELHKNGLTWAEIKQREAAAWSKSTGVSAPDSYSFGWGVNGQDTTTPSGLSKQEVAEMMTQGFTLAAILNADSMAASLGIDFRTIVRGISPEASLHDAVREHYSKLTPAERDEARSKVKPPSGEALEEFTKQTGLSADTLKTRKVVSVKLGDSGKTLSGLTEEEVMSLVTMGVELKELMSADARAYARGLNFRLILTTMKPGQSLLTLVSEADRITPANQRNLPPVSLKQPTEEELLQSYANKTGRTKEELSSLRTAGKTWREIMGVPEEHLAEALKVAEGWGLKDHELVHQALLQELWVNDAYQAALLAPATKLTPSEILAMKTKENTWLDVLKVLFPEKALPPVPEINPNLEPKPPVSLPAGSNGR